MRSNKRKMTLAIRKLLVWCSALGCSAAFSLHAQIDDTKRELIQLGYNQPLQGNSPLSAYAFYYLNQPHFFRSNITLRLAVAPVYLDSELGFSELLGPNTHFGLGVAGGGFAEGYSELRAGKYFKEESFTGHGAGVSGNIYHLFNPGKQIPLYAVLRNEAHFSAYERDSRTAPTFVLPEDKQSYNIRAGLRWGGREPLMQPDLAMELSAWYEGQFRASSGVYGFNGDRSERSQSHLFWGRALIAYTLPERKDNISLNLTVGTSVGADRFSAYRLGGVLPLAAEFPLSLPGYYYQEISARRFALVAARYSLVLNSSWALIFQGATAGVDYVAGLEQPGHWHSGVGSGISYRSPSDAWQIVLSYGYGVDALRSSGRGAHNIGFLLQFDFERTRHGLWPGEQPFRSRGLERLLRFE